MKAIEAITGLPPDLAADTQAVIDYLMTGKPINPEMAQRIRERGDHIREELFRKDCVLDIGVPAIHELRDE